jgi:lysophospholipase L1-like esterase
MRGNVWQLAGLALLALVTLGVVAYSLSPSTPPAATVSYTPEPLPTPTAVALPKISSFDAAAQKLRTTEDPFTLTIVGDSTGFAEQGWVVASLKDINRATGRTIEFSTWNMASGKYDPARTIGTGAPTLTVWNGSAPGKDATYSRTNLAALMPAKTDLLIINHGHNVGLPDTMRTMLVDAAAKAGPGSAVAIMKQNPEVGAGQSAQENRMKAVASIAADFPGVELIDAFAAFDVRNPALLMPDGVHPTAEGYRLWADVFLRRLGFA